MYPFISYQLFSHTLLPFGIGLLTGIGHLIEVVHVCNPTLPRLGFEVFESLSVLGLLLILLSLIFKSLLECHLTLHFSVQNGCEVVLRVLAVPLRLRLTHVN